MIFLLFLFVVLRSLRRDTRTVLEMGFIQRRRMEGSKIRGKTGDVAVLRLCFGTVGHGEAGCFGVPSGAAKRAKLRLQALSHVTCHTCI